MNTKISIKKIQLIIKFIRKNQKNKKLFIFYFKKKKNNKIDYFMIKKIKKKKKQSKNLLKKPLQPFLIFRNEMLKKTKLENPSLN